MCGASSIMRDFLVEVFAVVKVNLLLFKGKIAGKRASSRTRTLLSKIAATTTVTVFLSFLAMANIVILRGVVDMEIDNGKILAATLSSISLGFFFTGIAFLVGSFSQRKGSAIGVVTGVSLIAFLIYSLSALVDNFDAIEPYNPMEWGLKGQPLFNGLDGGGNLKLLIGGVLFLVLSILKFDKKDISTP